MCARAREGSNQTNQFYGFQTLKFRIRSIICERRGLLALWTICVGLGGRERWVWEERSPLHTEMRTAGRSTSWMRTAAWRCWCSCQLTAQAIDTFRGMIVSLCARKVDHCANKFVSCLCNWPLLVQTSSPECAWAGVTCDLWPVHVGDSCMLRVTCVAILRFSCGNHTWLLIVRIRARGTCIQLVHTSRVFAWFSLCAWTCDMLHWTCVNARVLRIQTCLNSCVNDSSLCGIGIAFIYN